MADELQSWFKDLPRKLQRELAGRLREIADDLAEEIKSKAPVRTGKLRDSVRVRRGKKSLEFFVEAGGAATTPSLNRSTKYEREVAIGSGDTQNIARGSSGEVTYDYSLAIEFGTSKMPAQPFFYSTYRERQADVREQIEEAVNEVLEKS